MSLYSVQQESEAGNHKQAQALRDWICRRIVFEGLNTATTIRRGGRVIGNIEYVQLGDLAWSRCDETGTEGFRPVTALFVTHPVELIHLSYRREGGSAGDDPDLSDVALAKSDSTLVGTRVHPFWSVDRAAWVDMGDLIVGERLRLRDGSFATVTRVQVEQAPCFEPAWIAGSAVTGTLGTHADPHTGRFTTYNFEVAQWHTYFAAPVGSTGTGDAVWVHNLNVGVCDKGRDAVRSYISEQKAIGRNVDRRTAIRELFETSESLLSKKRATHTLFGDATGGGHVFPGQAGKTPFPSNWAPKDILDAASDIATDPSIPWKPQTGSGGWYTKKGSPARFEAVGVRGGVRIRVIIEPAGEGIITAHPKP